jgi:hypothetical protein
MSKACPTRQGRTRILLSALENILDIPSAVQNTDNFNCAANDSTENDVPANCKTLNSRNQLFSVAPQAGLTGQQFHGLVDFVDKSIRIRLAIISNVAPNIE